MKEEDLRNAGFDSVITFGFYNEAVKPKYCENMNLDMDDMVYEFVNDSNYNNEQLFSDF